jgi:hypothetical protein
LLFNPLQASVQLHADQTQENLTMKKTLSLLAVAAAALFAAQAVMAQSPSRAEVKKETAEANKAGAIPGTGTGPSANVTPPISAKSDTPRAEVKKETAAANKAGAIPGTGTGPSANTTPAISSKSDVPRAEVKKETAAANKAGAIPGTGTGPSANVEPAKK